MKLTPEEQSNAYKASCNYYRKGHVIYNKDNSVYLTGESINAAKKLVRENGLKSFTVR